LLELLEMLVGDLLGAAADELRVEEGDDQDF
jgi:hypothetical protein